MFEDSLEYENPVDDVIISALELGLKITTFLDNARKALNAEYTCYFSIK